MNDNLLVFIIIVIIIYLERRIYNNIHRKKMYESFSSDGHESLKNVYGDPLLPCKTGTSPGSWDSDGYCSEMGGGVHQICFDVTEETSDFSTSTGQSNWSEEE